MKKILILSAIFITSGGAITLSKATQVKPAATTVTPTVANIKLAEAKALLSKSSNTKNFKSNLGTADGGI